VHWPVYRVVLTELVRRGGCPLEVNTLKHQAGKRSSSSPSPDRR
jgi:hypothetical protein